jgi:hypothetical protein
VRSGGAFGFGGYQWTGTLGQSRITITCHNLCDVGTPDAAVYDFLAVSIPCPDCGAPIETSCIGRSPKRGPHPARVRAANSLSRVRQPIKGKSA